LNIKTVGKNSSIIFVCVGNRVRFVSLNFNTTFSNISVITCIVAVSLIGYGYDV